MLHDWLRKKIAPLFDPMRSKQKPIGISLARVPRALRQLEVYTMSFDCFIGGFSVFFVIDQE